VKDLTGKNEKEVATGDIKNKAIKLGSQWPMPTILATWQGEIGRLEV
jgi:hypothetical protein